MITPITNAITPIRRLITLKLIGVIAFVIGVILFSSCDKIEPPYRETVATDTTCHFSTDNSTPYKKVFVEDYTGHWCGNCPDAGIYLNDSLGPRYSDTVVVISVHAGFFAGTCPSATVCTGSQPPGAFEYDFTCTAGNDWYSFFSIPTNPLALIDRIDYPTNKHFKTKDKWEQTIISELKKPATVRIRIENTYESSSRQLRTCVETKFITNVTADCNLQVVVTEDSILNWQQWYGHTPLFVPDYNHRHVLRTAMNSSFGVQIATNGSPGNTTVINGYKIALDPAWNDSHCRVVAFVYNNTTKEILQVEEKAIK